MLLDNSVKGGSDHRDGDTSVRAVSIAILIGLLVRVLLMPFTMHSDPRFISDLIVMQKMKGDFAEGTLQPLYPPLYSLTIDVAHRVIDNMMPATLSVDSFLEASTHQLPTLSNSHIYRITFLFKLLYLPIDVLLAISLFLLYRHNHYKLRRALIFWAVNPFIIYTMYFHGQFDIIPITCIMFGLTAAALNKPSWAVFWIGIGACYKNFPFLFLPPFVVILGSDWRSRLRLLLIGTLPYGLTMLPVLDQYRFTVSDYSNWFFKAGYDLGFGSWVFFFFVFYAVLLWHLYQKKAKAFEDLWRVSFAIMLIYYPFSYFDLHHWVWIVPFAAIYWVNYPQKAKPFFLVIGLCLLVLLAPTPLARFLAPLSPRFFLRLPSLMELFNLYLPMLFITNVVRSLLAGTCFFLVWRLLRGIQGPSEDSGQKASISTGGL